MGTHRISFGQRSRAGFTIIELAIVLVVISLLLMPLLRIAASSVGATRTQDTGAALATARDALVAFAASNNGCLPFAADFEGGLSDTDATGVVTSTSVDTGFGTADKHGGDLPWAELGLTNSLLDGDDLRIQYYVASPYTDDDADSSNGIKCNAGFRGFEWNSSVTYNGSVSNPLYVYHTDTTNNVRELYMITDAYPMGTLPPDAALGPEVDAIGVPLTSPLLQVRRGPDVTDSTNDQDAVQSAQTVFVLTAPGGNRNATAGRAYVRDANHVADDFGAAWALDTDPVDEEVIFSATQNIDGSDSNNDGDDTLLVMSFTNFKAAVSKYGLNMEKFCEVGC